MGCPANDRARTVVVPCLRSPTSPCPQGCGTLVATKRNPGRSARGRVDGALLTLAYLALFPAAVDAQECRYEENTCYSGPNLPINFPGSAFQGCQEKPQLQDCCTMCVNRWPDCQSWQYVTSNNYPGVPRFFCCLKAAFRSEVSTEHFGCISGFQNPSCTVTANCEAKVYGQGLSSTDEVLVRPEGQGCATDVADVDAAFWPEITNPASVKNDGAFNTYEMGKAPSGVIGSRRICHRSSSLLPFSTTVGEFTMRGPYQNQSHKCTLGTDCELTLLGLDMLSQGAKYRLAIVSNPPCGENAIIAQFSALENPVGVEESQNYDTYKLGRPTAGNTLDAFSLCWAAQVGINSRFLPAAHTQPAGTFEMLGPLSTGTHNCTMGAPCHVNVIGRGLAATNGVMVIPGTSNTLCGSVPPVDATKIIGFINPTYQDPEPPYEEHSLGYLYSIGIPEDYQHGHDYRLCWAALRDDQPPSGKVTNFLVDVGQFTMIGPLAKPYNCWLTYPCTIELEGTGLDMNDRVLLSKIVMSIDGVCGQSNSPVHMEVTGDLWENPQPMQSADDTEAVAVIGTASWAKNGIVGLPHNLCWAGEVEDYMSYKLMVGLFVMHGPFIEDNTCYKGLNCIITLAGSGFAQTNEVAIMRSALECGNPNASIADFVPTDVFEMSVVQHVQRGLFNEYRLGYPILGTAREDYVLCWSHKPTISSPAWTAESTVDDFSFQDFSFVVGTLSIAGANEKALSCYLSTHCILQLDGVLLTQRNRIIVITAEQQCGAAAPPYAIFGDADTAADRFYNLAPVRDPWKVYDLGTLATGTPAINYRMCWANDPENPVDRSLYRSPIGLLTIFGPDSPLIPDIVECTMSLFCTIRLTGIGLQHTNSIQIVKKPRTCLTVRDEDVANLAGIPNPQGPSADDAWRYDMGWLGSGLPGGNYWLCWAHDPSVMNDFRTTLGTFRLLGPHVIDGAGSTNVQECILGRPCEVTVEGEELTEGNKILIVNKSDVCSGRESVLDRAVFEGSPNPAVNDPNDFGRFSLALPTSTAVPGNYKVCWSFGGVENEDFIREVGTLYMGGPFMQYSECFLSEPCKIVLLGNSFSSFSSVLILRKDVSGDTRCGDGVHTTPAATVPRWAGIDNPKKTSNAVTPSPTPGFVLDTYDLGTGYSALTESAKVGRQFLLCWAYNPPGGEGFMAFKVPIGDFAMNGPNEGTSSDCVLGIQCNVGITGFGLSSQNQVRITTYDCMTGSPAVLPGLDNPKTVTDDAWDNRFAMGMVTAGGSYAACKKSVKGVNCIGSHYKLCWAQGTTPNYIVEVGGFAMQGPFLAYKTQCFIGAVCAFKIYGSKLSASNRVLVIEEASKCGERNPLVVPLPGLRNPQMVSQVSSDGSEAVVRLGSATGGSAGRLRLCWGYEPKLLSEYNIEVGPFVFGPPPELCSVENGMLMSCTLPPSDD
eukprot:TRINITY_DN54693_c0_g1_i1.p1 TRINITY_DN54693_c0_g1~~TRINITY_DN54693_c0_g1_i1.p1  ORF type:complete len:1437 (+),score=197.20 TRINITY_DN54693_c0_g1_i1:182-4492(+)